MARGIYVSKNSDCCCGVKGLGFETCTRCGGHVRKCVPLGSKQREHLGYMTNPSTVYATARNAAVLAQSSSHVQFTTAFTFQRAIVSKLTRLMATLGAAATETAPAMGNVLAPNLADNKILYWSFKRGRGSVQGFEYRWP
jgi:hypothetical protein